ncbi:MAG: uroporphyrinogen decarboxylase family protein [Phycisphaeraceae bacterium]
MTKHENFVRMMRGEGAAWLPLDLPMTPPIVDEMQARRGTRHSTDAFDLDFHHVSFTFRTDVAAWRAAFAALGAGVPDHAEIGPAAVTHVRPAPESVGKAYHFRTMLHPLEVIQRVEQLDTLPWPDLTDASAIAKLPGEVARGREAGRAVFAGTECTVFELAWYMRGMDNLFMDLAENNGIADWLLDWVTNLSVARVRAYALAGVDAIGLGDDVGVQRGMMMAPEFWRTHLKPRLARVIQTIRQHQGDKHIYVRYHSDGDIREILDDLIEVGVDILNPVQPECMPVDEVLAAYGDRLAFWGMIGTQTTMPFGSVADVHAVVDHLADLARGGARMIIAPTHVLEPDVPWENIEALVERVKATRLDALVL